MTAQEVKKYFDSLEIKIGASLDDAHRACLCIINIWQPKFKVVLFFIFLLVLPAQNSFAQKSKQKWVLFSENNHGYDWYYDTTTIKKYGSLCYVWNEIIPTQDSLNAIRIRLFLENDRDSSWLKYGGSKQKIVFNCRRGKMAILEATQYDVTGKALSTEDEDDGHGFFNVDPGSAGEDLQKIISK